MEPWGPVGMAAIYGAWVVRDTRRTLKMMMENEEKSFLLAVCAAQGKRGYFCCSVCSIVSDGAVLADKNKNEVQSNKSVIFLFLVLSRELLQAE